MFLPQKEMHELSLLFFAYLFKSQNQHIIYLGANVPFADIQPVIDVYHPNYIFTTLTSSIGLKSTTIGFDVLSRKNKKINFLVAGTQASHLLKIKQSNLKCYCSMQEVLRLKF
jgi:MerR family transcriptional regulator, light-induced transcriptional regulator